MWLNWKGSTVSSFFTFRFKHHFSCKFVRYIKYFSRYDEHGKSINFAHKQREAATERMHAMLKDEAQKCSTLIDVEYLIQAVNQVCSTSNTEEVQGYTYEI